MLQFIALQDTAAANNGGGGGMGLLMILAILVVFWLFMIRPQQKQQKELRKKQAALKKGDKVVLSSGIHGVVSAVDEKTLNVEIDKNVVITVEKSSVYPSADDATKATSR